MKPKIGMWQCMCCIEDLYEIKDEDDLESVASFLPGGENDDGPAPMIFETFDDGLRWCLQDGDWALERAVERFGQDAVKMVSAKNPTPSED